jgi:2-polyprenyl-6-methoxyphenol hydroxylase-like FAD-dependent oxidoreductase
MSTRIGRQAVVVGAGMSGLTVARSLADRFEHVLVLERDSLPADATHRMGTPQGRHLHGLLGGGQRALADLFPSFEQDLARAGAVSNRVGLDLRVERPGYDPFPQRDLGWLGYSMSRPLIELTARRRVEQHANITLRERSRAQGFVATHDGATVTGVRCESVDGKKETLLADLVVDASGRGSLTLDLLESVGRPLPEETVIGVDIAYSAAVFAIPDGAPPDWKGVMTFPQAPQSSRGALMVPIENGRWILSVGGAHGDTPPGDGDGFLSYVRQLRTPTVYNAIKHAKRAGARSPASAFRPACGAILSGLRPSRTDCSRWATRSAALIPSTARA